MDSMVRRSKAELLELTSLVVLEAARAVHLLSAVVTSATEDLAVVSLARLTLCSLVTSASRLKTGPSSSSSVDAEKSLR